MDFPQTPQAHRRLGPRQLDNSPAVIREDEHLLPYTVENIAGDDNGRDTDTTDEKSLDEKNDADENDFVDVFDNEDTMHGNRRVSLPPLTGRTKSRAISGKSIVLHGEGSDDLHRQLTLTSRRVKLTQGNFILDCAIPRRLQSFFTRWDHEEYQHMRYTAVTGAPEDFKTKNITLRTKEYERETEIMVVITLYNEDASLFCRTLHGVMKNIANLCERKNSRVWNKDAWQKVVVCVVADGRAKIHPRVLDCLSALGIYQEGICQSKIEDKDVAMHLFEYTTQLSINSKLEFRAADKGIQPMQMLLGIKEKNQRKLNSHRWALEAFAEALNPNIIVFLDAGTKPHPQALYRLWKTFDNDSSVGGACGELSVQKGKGWKDLINPLVAAQNFEYKMSSALDKPTESSFGFISVLPGAFSAYRWIAVKSDGFKRGPLASYFVGESLSMEHTDMLTNNMYLAEDRILCWELVSRPECSWILKYVRGARAETDVPDNVTEFINQRRRWLNGSFSAACFVVAHTLNLRFTEHTWGRKVLLYSQAVYSTMNIIFTWFGLANFYIFFRILTVSLEDSGLHVHGLMYLNIIMQYMYLGTLVTCFVLSLGNRPQGTRWMYLGTIIIFSITTAYMIAAGIVNVVRVVMQIHSGPQFAIIIISLFATYGCWILASLMALDPWHLITSCLQYMLLSPMYVSVLQIFAFSNLHDFSWGTKQITQDAHISAAVAASPMKGNEVDVELPTSQEDIDEAYEAALDGIRVNRPVVAPPVTSFDMHQVKADRYKTVRTYVMLVWVLSNALIAGLVLRGDLLSTFNSKGSSSAPRVYMIVILVFVTLWAVIRLIGSFIYSITELIERSGGGERIHAPWSKAKVVDEESGDVNDTSYDYGVQPDFEEVYGTPDGSRSYGANAYGGQSYAGSSFNQSSGTALGHGRPSADAYRHSSYHYPNHVDLD